SGYNASIKNSGDIVATSANNLAVGMQVLGAYADATNTSNVSAYGIVAAGVDSEGAYAASVNNSGNVVANGYVRAYGLLAYASYGDASVANTGNVDVDAFGVAYG